MQLSTAQAPDVEHVSGRYALHNCEPWIVPEAVEYLSTLVRPEWKVFEWGCGGSLIWFAERCTKVVGVETVPRWVAWAMDRLQERMLTNTHVIHAPIWQGKYTEYIGVIEAYPKEFFDLVSIDGVMSARKDSIARAKAKLKPDGIIMIDNSNKFNVKNLDDWAELRFQTLPHLYLGKTEVWCTSFYTRKLTDDKNIL